MPAYLRAGVTAYLRAGVPGYLRAGGPAYLHASVPAYLRTYVPAYRRTLRRLLQRTSGAGRILRTQPPRRRSGAGQQKGVPDAPKPDAEAEVTPHKAAFEKAVKEVNMKQESVHKDYLSESEATQ